LSSIDSILSYAKSLKIDECEAIFCQSRVTTIRITDSEITEVKQNSEKKLGVRIIHQKKIFGSESTILDNPASITDSALRLASFQNPKMFWKSLPSQLKKISLEKLYDKRLAEISGNKATDIAQQMINAASDKKVTSITGSLNIVSEKFELGNSNGLRFTDDATYIAGTINADSDIGSMAVSGIGHASCRTLDAFDANAVGNDAKNMCIDSINPQRCEEGEYSIIFEPYSVGEILSFVFASNFNLKTYSEKRSCFSGMLDSKIAVDEFTVLDDPHAKEGIGSKSFDDEGVSTQVKPLIENGIFKNVYSDLFDAYKEEKDSSGNASREGSPMGRDSQPIPQSAPHNLHLTGEKITKEEIIKETKRGLLVGRLWYTYAVNPIKGDFSCTARSGVRIIENGKIKSPGKSFRIVHNLPLLLQNISAIGNDEKNVLQWASLPSIAPTVRADGIKITPIS
jgi:PmbA protein